MPKKFRPAGDCGHLKGRTLKGIGFITALRTTANIGFEKIFQVYE
jgi:hypothetical protein